MSNQQHIQFKAEKAGRDFRGEVVDSATHETIARTALTYPTQHMAETGARNMWQRRTQRIASTLSGQVIA
jgi:hypothetical protein